MLNEDKVPIRDRRLLVEGQVSPKTLELLREGSPATWPDTARCFLVTYSYADLPLGKQFDFAFPQHQPTHGVKTVAIVRAVTQQFGKPFDTVPHGWKTICVIEFPKGLPGLIAGLPTLTTWGESKERVGLCSRDTMEALLSESA